MSESVSTIEGYYSNILQRPADQAGLDFWVTQADSGTSLAQIETGIATSPEAMTFVYPIAQFYQGILGRNPDPSGLNFWVNEYRTSQNTPGPPTPGPPTPGGESIAFGQSFSVNDDSSSAATSLTTIATAFVDSPEGQAELGTTLSIPAVQILYENCVDRIASPAELNFWLTSDLSFGQVAEDISLSPEATAFLAEPTLSYLLNAGNGIFPFPPTPSTLIT